MKYIALIVQRSLMSECIYLTPMCTIVKNFTFKSIQIQFNVEEPVMDLESRGQVVLPNASSKLNCRSTCLLRKKAADILFLDFPSYTFFEQIR